MNLRWGTISDCWSNGRYSVAIDGLGEIVAVRTNGGMIHGGFHVSDLQEPSLLEVIADAAG